MLWGKGCGYRLSVTDAFLKALPRRKEHSSAFLVTSRMFPKYLHEDVYSGILTRPLCLYLLPGPASSRPREDKWCRIWYKINVSGFYFVVLFFHVFMVVILGTSDINPFIIIIIIFVTCPFLHWINWTSFQKIKVMIIKNKRNWVSNLRRFGYNRKGKRRNEGRARKEDKAWRR